MSYISIIFIIIFYIFFFVRTLLLQRELGQSIKAKDSLANLSIVFAGLASLIFVLKKINLINDELFLVLYGSLFLEIIGTALILIGLIISSIASLGLGSSWRIGVDTSAKTELVTTGIYARSRNPYFLSYDMVLLGMIASSASILVIFFSTVTILLFHRMILHEEKYLQSAHGEEYLKYKKKVRGYF